MKTLYTAIIGDYDDLKEPLKPEYVKGWRLVCFTDREITSKHWQIVRVSVMNCGPTKTARFYKIMFHKHIQSEFSLWIDGTFFINTHLDTFWLNNYSDPFTVMKHPIDDCIYTDVQSCIKAGKDTEATLTNQKRLYQRLGLPRNNGLAATGIIMRRDTPETRKFCNTWWEQVKQHSSRDQIAFGYAAWKMPGLHRFMPFNYTQHKEFIHLPHKNKPWREQKKIEILAKYGSDQE